MAVISKIKVKTQWDNVIELWKWDLLTNGDTGEPLIAPSFSAISIQASAATWGSNGRILMQGSNMRETDTPEYVQLTDPQGNALELNTNKLVERVLESTYLIRPYVAEGDGDTSLSVYALVRR